MVWYNHNWSAHQQAAFREIASTDRHLEINAVAGSAKTTTLIQATNYVEDGKSVLMMAFNKSTAEHDKAMMDAVPRKCATEVSTMHSYGFSLLRKHRPGRIKVDFYKCRNYLEQTFNYLLEKKSTQSKFDLIEELVLAVRSKGFLQVEDIPKEELEALYLESQKDGQFDLTEVIEMAKRSIRRLDQITHVVDFDDMIRGPVLAKLALRETRYDIVMVDEAQDLNPTQIEMVRQLSAHAKIVYVGDRRQAIYEFRGADTTSMDKMAEFLDPVKLELPVTYRVPHRVVDFVKDKFQDLNMISESGVAGSVIEKVYDPDDLANSEIEFVVAARNKDLRKVWTSYVEAGKRALIKGDDPVAESVKWLRQEFTDDTQIYEVHKKVEDLGELRGYYQYLASKLVIRYDPFEKLKWFFLKWNEIKDTTPTQFHTVHSAKGLEAEKVAVLDWSWFDSSQSENMKYVAYTRSLNSLTLYK